MDALQAFSAPTRTWFDAAFQRPTRAQAEGWPAISSGQHTLIHAPTGSGKTLAAFLWTLDRLLAEPLPPSQERCRVLYISPLKALAHDVDRNLRAPLAGIQHAAQRLGGSPLHQITTFLRTGDTPQEERRRMERHPADILITTPESLYLMLTSAVRSVLRTVRWVIIDEVHALAATKRGAHLALSLERLEELTLATPQRIGLSATQRPLEAIAGFLGGGTVEVGGEWRPRPVTIVDVPPDRELDLELVVPVEDMTAPGETDPLAADAPPQRSIWPAVYPALLEQIESHRSTIVFANSRRLAERVCAELNRLADYEIARAHHGSVSRHQRLEIEESLKRGELKAVVATSSLELGIDMGAVDLVVQIEAPGSVAAGLQRVGRSGHHVGGVSRAKIFPKYRGDLLVSAVVADRMLNGLVEETKVPSHPLDVLAQQVVAQVVTGETAVEDLYGMVRRATPYKNLSRAVFDETLDMLAGRYPSDLFSELRPRINWDRVSGTLTPRPGALRLAVTNAGTIPDRGMFRVLLSGGGRVGELDEEMVYESRQGDTFLLGSTAWRIAEIGHDTVTVVPAPPDTSHKMPFWRGDMPGRPLETGRAVGRFTGEIGALEPASAIEVLQTTHHLDGFAAANLVQYLSEETEATGHLPTDRKLVVERFQDEIGDWRVVLLSPFGARVHAPWAMALRQRFTERFGSDVDMIYTDDGIAFRFPDVADVPTAADMAIDPDEIEAILIEHIGSTSLFAARFREAAGRSLLLPRRRPGERVPLWLQRRRASDLLSVASRFGSFPIVLETYREVLQDDFDLPGLKEVLADIAARRTRLVEVELPGPSPFATSLLFSFVAAYLYESDAPSAERRAAALTLDRNLLRELLGDGELRDLIDPEVVVAVELELQHLTDARRSTKPDSLHDMLRDLGPLSYQDVMVRTGETGPEDLTRLVEEGRVYPVTVSGEERYAAVEDIGRLRDALGVPPPMGVPLVFLEPVPDPLGDVVGRYARTHAPFAASDAASSLGLPLAVVERVLGELETAGRVTRGAFLPGGEGQEWSDTGVLRRLKRRSLASLRQEIEPVDQHRLAQFAVGWGGIGARTPRGRDAVGRIVEGLEGAVVPASILERDVLAARVPEAAGELDRMMVAGELVWVGRGPLGPRDGRLSLFHRDSLGLLWGGPDPDHQPGPLGEAIVEHLRRRGASFFRDIYQAVGGGDMETASEALWDLVWAGMVTNDTFEPVRHYLGRRRVAPRSRRLGAFPAHTSGRWSLIESMILSPAGATESQAAWAELLLDRHGVVTRSTVVSEGHPGGFAGLYPVFSHLEEMGRARRGYFVEGMGGAQFALPGAVDRLRSDPGGDVISLAAADPANYYGSVLGWPEHPSRLAREAGAYVILAGGRLVAYLDRGRRNLVVLPDGHEVYPEIGRELAAIAARHRRLVLHTVDETPAPASPLAPSLREWGFALDPKGLAFRR